MHFYDMLGPPPHLSLDPKILASLSPSKMSINLIDGSLVHTTFMISTRSIVNMIFYTLQVDLMSAEEEDDKKKREESLYLLSGW